MKQNTRHKETIIAWLKGAAIQRRCRSDGEWYVTEDPTFRERDEYRVVTQRFVNVYSDGSCSFVHPMRMCADSPTSQIKGMLVSTYHDGELVDQTLEKIP